ncbi:pseudaminic acid synthase, partial [Lachnotalea glycerini]
NLKTMVNMAETFNVSVGLSDHSMGSLGAVTAVAMGAQIIEKHFCMSREIESPDSSFSMEPIEFAAMVNDIRTVEKAIGNVFYGVSNQEKNNVLFRRSIFVIEDIKFGEPFTEENIKVIRPGDGISPKYYNSIIGKISTQSIKRGTPLKHNMIGSEWHEK